MLECAVAKGDHDFFYLMKKLEIDLKEKNKAIEALSSALHTTQMELQNEVRRAGGSLWCKK